MKKFWNWARDDAGVRTLRNGGRVAARPHIAPAEENGGYENDND